MKNLHFCLFNVQNDAILHKQRNVAQPGSALLWGSRGRWFKSSRSDHKDCPMQEKTFITTVASFQQDLENTWFLPEKLCVTDLYKYFEPIKDIHETVAEKTIEAVNAIRLQKRSTFAVEAIMENYNLSTKEGIALMALAEALLRTPDAYTKMRLISDKLSSADWNKNEEQPFLQKLLQYGLVTAKDFTAEKESYLHSLAKKISEPVILKVTEKMMRSMGSHFVFAETISQAIKNSADNLYSFDMLGEGARTLEDTENYFQAYKQAIQALPKNLAQSPYVASGISVKLSALHPRLEVNQRQTVIPFVVDKVLQLVAIAREKNIAVTIDAEESYRLQLTLDIFEQVLANPQLQGYKGFGLAVQAYQKRALNVVEACVKMANHHKRYIHIRLVKGAYWDTEIKDTQVKGLTDYPVFTQKPHTDLSYYICAHAMLQASENIYAQFASHNLYSIIFVKTLAESLSVQNYEFQRLHGMGEDIYRTIHLQSRIYAPIGKFADLLPYLVRRLLENGANANFVHQIYDKSFSPDVFCKSIPRALEQTKMDLHPLIALPKNLYLPSRKNSKGHNLDSYNVLKAFENTPHENIAEPLPLDQQQLTEAFDQAKTAYPVWSSISITERVKVIENLADLLEKNIHHGVKLIQTEGKKTLRDAIDEYREAIDFCYYYSERAKELFTQPVLLPGPTGETNQLFYTSRGVFVCISPWNFPLAIFLGQVVAALVCGNTVLAKPSHQTPRIAAWVVDLLYKAGLVSNAVKIVDCAGKMLSDVIITRQPIAGVCLTGSTVTAKTIQKNLALNEGPIVPFIAETGGINAMIVDSSALLEQVTDAVVRSAFQSAGQRCSALRLLCVQNEIFDSLLQMLKGAINSLQIGNPLDVATDVGPLIDDNAAESVRLYLKNLSANKSAQCLHVLETQLNENFIPPQIWLLDSILILKEEIFAPVLHIVKYDAKNLNEIVEEINRMNYGLTFGVHSRIDSMVKDLSKKMMSGNIYINRDTIGAVVGVQPFGGMNLSGTGPKAGGPNYLQAFCHEKVITNNTAAAGGDAVLLGKI